MPNVAVHGVLAHIRAALTDLVADLIALTPQDQQVPDGAPADLAIRLVVNGDPNVINYSPQHAGDGGTNVMVSGPGAGPVAVTGSQTASGAGVSVTARQRAIRLPRPERADRSARSPRGNKRRLDRA